MAEKHDHTDPPKCRGCPLAEAGIVSKSLCAGYWKPETGAKIKCPRDSEEAMSELKRKNERKYKSGKPIQTVADFENSKCDFFMVTFWNRTTPRHRGFLISWQYRTLKNFIDRGWIYEADSMQNAIQ